MLKTNIFKNKKLIRKTYTVSSNFNSLRLLEFPELLSMYKSYKEALTETNTPNAVIRQKQAFKDFSFFANEYKGAESLSVTIKQEEGDRTPIISISNDKTYEFLRKLTNVYALFFIFEKEERKHLFPDLELEKSDFMLLSNDEWVHNASLNFKLLCVHYLIDTDLDLVFD